MEFSASIPSIAEILKENPPTFRLEQNYPNPFNPLTTIIFELTEEATVSLKVYNVIGQEVATLVDDEIMNDGEQSVDFHGENLPSGAYFYRITAVPTNEHSRTQIFSRKMLLMK